MAITLDGTNGITNDSGYTGDGVSFADSTPANTLVTTSGGNVGIGTSSPASKLHVSSTGAVSSRFVSTQATNYLQVENSGGGAGIASNGDALTFWTSINGTERARIDSSGNLLVGTTSNTGNGRVCIAATWPQNPLSIDVTSSNSTASVAQFFFNGSNVGLIVCSASSTSYNTSSDYRLKHDIQPMTGALAKVQELKPVTYKWKHDDSAGEGFIAHELQEVCPSAVTGEKDAVDAEGNPKYQGIDTSFLVATLTAAIQEQQALINAQQAALESLTARVVALENQIV